MPDHEPAVELALGVSDGAGPGAQPVQQFSSVTVTLEPLKPVTQATWPNLPSVLVAMLPTMGEPRTS